MLTNLQTYLSLNAARAANSKDIVMKLILRSHTHFYMKQFCDWGDLEVEVLPLAVSWFDRAGSLRELEEGMQSRDEMGKLSYIYQFARAIPLMFVPG